MSNYPNFEQLKPDRHNAPARERFKAIISKNKKWVVARQEINGEKMGWVRISALSLLFVQDGILFASNPGTSGNDYERGIYNIFPIAKDEINGSHGDFIAQQIEIFMSAADADEDQEEEKDEPPITADTILNDIQINQPEQPETKQTAPAPAQPAEEPPPPPPSGIDELLSSLGFGLTPTPEPEPETKPTAADRINRINELHKQFEESQADRIAARNRFLESKSKKD